MTTINEIFRTFGPEYLERYSQVMPKVHRKVIDAIPSTSSGQASAVAPRLVVSPFMSARSVANSIGSIAPACLCVPHADRWKSPLPHLSTP